MSLVFLDANCLIYLVEQHAEHGPRVSHLVRRMIERGDSVCTSTLAVGEVMAGPRMHGDSDLEARYRDLFATAGWRLLPFDRAAVEHFVSARAMPGVKAPDAIHLACAAQARVDVFVTHDKALAGRHVSGIGFVVGLATDIFGVGDRPL